MQFFSPLKSVSVHKNSIGRDIIWCSFCVYGVSYYCFRDEEFCHTNEVFKDKRNQ